jgi:hypothetical protein
VLFSFLSGFTTYWTDPSKSPRSWLGGKSSDNTSSTSHLANSLSGNESYSPWRGAMCGGISRMRGFGVVGVGWVIGSVVGGLGEIEGVVRRVGGEFVEMHWRRPVRWDRV